MRGAVGEFVSFLFFCSFSRVFVSPCRPSWYRMICPCSHATRPPLRLDPIMPSSPTATRPPHLLLILHHHRPSPHGRCDPPSHLFTPHPHPSSPQPPSTTTPDNHAINTNPSPPHITGNPQPRNPPRRTPLILRQP